MRIPQRAVLGLSALLSVVGTLALAPDAGASFHEIKVREVFPGSAANPDSDYVVLQAYSGGQNIVNAGVLRIYNADGTTASNYTPTSTVPSGANQMTVLIADSAYATQFPTGPAPDFANPTLDLNPAAGAVCWPVGSAPIDCASWGAFTGAASLPSPNHTGSPASPTGITDGQAIRRRIDSGCETLLQTLDDNNQNSTDFPEVTPAPRNNSTVPTESNCVLNVSVTGSGTVTSVGEPGISCPPDCTQTYFSGEFFNLNATPVAGGMFNSWTACPGTPMMNVCQGVNMSQSRTASADFAVVTPTPSTPGTGTTTTTPTDNFDLPAAKRKCKRKYPAGAKRTRCIRKAKQKEAEIDG